MWLVCQIIGYPRNCCLVSSSMENAPLVGPKKRYKDTLKGSLKSFNLNPDTWELAAQNRNEWRAALHNGAKKLTRKREPSQRRKDGRRGNQMQIGAHPLPPSPAPKCTRTFRAQIGLTSHLRTHQ